MSTKSLHYVWHSQVHIALLYGKMTKEPFTLSELRDFTPAITRKCNKRIVTALEKAESVGHVRRLGALEWVLTEQGADYLVYMAAAHRRAFPLPEEEQNEPLCDEWDGEEQ